MLGSLWAIRISIFHVVLVQLFKDCCDKIVKFDFITTLLIYAGHLKTSSTKG